MEDDDPRSSPRSGRQAEAAAERASPVGAEFLGAVARSWGRSPTRVLLATDRTHVAAALWADDGGRTEELTADVSVAVNAICLACEQSDVETTVDGRLLHKGIVPEGSFNVVRPGERSRGVNRGRWERLHIYLPTALLRDLAAEAGAGGGGGSVELVNPVWRIDPSVLRIGREVVRELRTGPALSRLRLDALSQDLAITLLRSHSNLGGPARRLGRDGRGGLAPWQVRRAMAAMDARLDGDIGLAELAALCGVSSAHFGRAFKVSTGLSPIAWMLRRRIDLAKALLLDGRLTVAQIALAVGFSAPPQFSTAFRRVTGAAPTEWKRARRS